MPSIFQVNPDDQLIDKGDGIDVLGLVLYNSFLKRGLRAMRR